MPAETRPSPATRPLRAAWRPRPARAAPCSRPARPRAAERTRTLSQHLRVFDEHTRSEIKRKRLDALEQDNWQVDRRKEEEEDDAEAGAPGFLRKRMKRTG